jgi:hypothetical protein
MSVRARREVYLGPATIFLSAVEHEYSSAPTRYTLNVSLSWQRRRA